MVLHIPVLLKEIGEMLVTKGGGLYVDATVGFGGHLKEILSRLNDDGRLIAIDKDKDAISHLQAVTKDNRVTLLRGSFSDLTDLLASINIRKIDGILFDLGVSLFQLKEQSRGFSFISDSRLDMRMDSSQTKNAWEVVNLYSRKDLERIFREYGEEPLAGRIVKKIIEERRLRKVNTCRELAMLAEKVYGGRGKIHPATRIFQAIRIEVNRELEELNKGLASAYELLTAEGRLCVISYHSLEDRIVKNFFRDSERAHRLRILTKKPIQASTEEVRSNPSSRSAKLRGAEKI